MTAAQWIVVRTKPRQEASTDERIRDQGFETIFPLGRYRQRVCPLFPGYVFVGVERCWRSLLSTRGVLHVVRREDGTPGQLRFADVQRLRGMGVVDLDRGIYVGDVVHVTCGVYAGHTGIYDGLCSRRGRARVLFALLGRMVPVELEETALELA